MSAKMLPLVSSTVILSRMTVVPRFASAPRECWLGHHAERGALTHWDAF